MRALASMSLALTCVMSIAAYRSRARRTSHVSSPRVQAMQCDMRSYDATQRINRKRVRDTVATLLRLRSGHYVRHCRARDCERYIDTLTDAFVDSGAKHTLDPFLLIAIASRESGLDDTRVGTRGEFGVMQLHPRSRHGLRARARCKQALSSCTAIVIDVAAAHMRDNITRCKSVTRALTRYNTGQCNTSLYAHRILAMSNKY